MPEIDQPGNTISDMARAEARESVAQAVATAVRYGVSQAELRDDFDGILEFHFGPIPPRVPEGD